MNAPYSKPLPTIDERNRPHWAGNAAGELRVQRCDDCGTLRFPASRWCPHCLSESTSWQTTSGKGQVWSGACSTAPISRALRTTSPMRSR